MARRSRFDTTHWSLILAARGTDSAEASQALAELCESYWYPLYAYVRRRGYDADRAGDLTQAFFLRFLEKEYLKDVRPEVGKFRSFLLASLKHFLANEWDRSQALKRTADRNAISLDEDVAEGRYALHAVDELTPESIYERQWAMTVLERALDRMRREQESRGNRVRFEHLQQYLTSSQGEPPYREVASRLGITEGAVKTAIYRLRREFGHALRVEVSPTVQNEKEVDAELKYLLSVVSPG